MPLNGFLQNFTAELQPFFQEYHARSITLYGASLTKALWEGPYTAASIAYIQIHHDLGSISHESLFRLKERVSSILAAYKPECMSKLEQITSVLKTGMPVPDTLSSSLFEDLDGLKLLTIVSEYFTPTEIDPDTVEWIVTEYAKSSHISSTESPTAESTVDSSPQLLFMLRRDYELRSKEASRIFRNLVRNPMSMLSKQSSNNPNFYGYGVNREAEEVTFTHSLYGCHLAECHCMAEFSRGARSFRIVSENYLVRSAQSFAGKKFKLAIIGSGTLFQVTVVLAKLAENVMFSEIDLDLVDPMMFHDRNRDGFRHTADAFRNILSDMGFALRFGPASSTFYDFHYAAGLGLKGKVNIEFYATYNQAADIIFANDVPLWPDDAKLFLDAANPGAFYISALRRDYHPAKGGYPGPVLFEFSRKGAEGKWNTLVSTRNVSEAHGALYTTDISTLPTARMVAS